MAYSTDDLYKKSMAVIAENNLFFVEDVCAYMGIAKPTFYKHFPIDSNEMNSIKEAIEKNKTKTKVSLRSKLHSSTSPTGLLALYKLVCTDEERRALSMQHHDVTTGGEKINKVTFEYVRPQDTSQ